MLDRIFFIIHRLSSIIPYLTLILPILAYVLLFINGQYLMMMKGSPILIALTIISVILIVNRKKLSNPCENKLFDELLLPKNLCQRNLSKIFWIVFCVAFVLILVTNSCSLFSLILAGLLYLLVLLEIFSPKPRKPVILFQLISTLSLHVFSTVFTHAYYYGWTDIPIHLAWTETILIDGVISPILGQYTDFCLFHIESATASLISGLTTYTTLYLTSTPLIIISLVFIYSIAKHFTKSTVLSLLSSFLYVTIPAVIWYAIYPMPRMHATFAFVFFLFIFFRKSSDGVSLSSLILTIFALIYMILVHHAQLILIVLVFTGILGLYFIYHHRITASQVVFTVLFYFVSLFGIMRGPYNFSWVMAYLTKQLSNIPLPDWFPVAPVSAASPSSLQSIGGLSAVPPSSFDIVTNLGNLGGAWINAVVSAVFILVLLPGVISLLSPKIIDKKIAMLGMAGVVLAIIFIPGVMDLFEMVINGDLELDRIRLVLSPIFAVIMAVGAVVVGNLWNKKYTGKFNGAVVTVILCMLLVVTSPLILESRDSPVFAGTQFGEVHFFTEQELSSFDIVEHYLPLSSSIYTDYDTSRYFATGKAFEKYGYSYYSFRNGADKLYSEDVSVESQVKYVINRNGCYEIYGLGVRDSAGTTVKILPTEENTKQFTENTYLLSLVYTNQGVNIFS